MKPGRRAERCVLQEGWLQKADGHQSLGDKQGFSLRASGAVQPCGHPDWGFWPPELGEDTFLLA